MTTTTSSGSHSVKDNFVNAKLNFYLDPSLGGQDSFAIGRAGAYRRKFDERPMTIRDARGYQDEFEIDTHGFQHGRRPSTVKDFTNDEEVNAVAYAEAQQLNKDL
jgi:hypothetical protein